MKSKQKLWVICLSLTLLSQALIADETRNSSGKAGWIEGELVHFSDGRYWIDTNAGCATLTVLDYDERSDCYLVECWQLGKDLYYPTPDE